MQRLSTSQIKPQREALREAQLNACALCGEYVPVDEAVLDHDHKTGHCRDVLHRGCNAMLGHIENNRPRHKLLGGRLKRMLAAVFEYIHKDYRDRPLHPTHRTPEQKQERTKTLARKRRAAKKGTE